MTGEAPGGDGAPSSPAPSSPGESSSPPSSAAPPPEERSRFWTIVVVLVIGPLLFLAWRTGERITAQRKAWKIAGGLAATRAGERPDPRYLIFIERGSPELLDELDQRVREGRIDERVGIALNLAASRRREALRPLVLALRDGCLDIELVTQTRSDFAGKMLPPDQLALELGATGKRLVSVLASDEDPFVRAWAATWLAASGTTPLDESVVSLLGTEGLLRERAAAVVASAALSGGVVAPDAVPALVAEVGSSSRGRIVARLLAERFVDHVPAAKRPLVETLSRELDAADVQLAVDERAPGRAARALVHGDASAAAILGKLAPRDPGALAALVAAVESTGMTAPLRCAAIAALASSSDESARSAIRAASDDPEPRVREAARRAR